ncbi:hypothetical protein TNCV_569031 [Trichonephila clavipes]|nr:hypothetical protein TNCV_569031 [Trichonephila clavipes]
MSTSAKPLLNGSLLNKRNMFTEFRMCRVSESLLNKQGVPGSLGQTLRGGRGHHKNSDLQSNSRSEMSSFGTRGCCSQEQRRKQTSITAE